VDRVLAGRVSSVKEWVDYVGRDHLHHRMESLLGSQEDAVLLICSLSCALSAGAMVILMASPASAFLLIVQAIAILLMVSVLERSGRGSA
jgi:UDP-GlcNAc:undecaprenyl-phosphate GlcNAc-1-phosphate transferase